MKILIVASHPDDEVLGCGGTIKRLTLDGHAVFLQLLGAGITSRDGYAEKDIENMKKSIYESNKILGIQQTFMNEFPDNAFDSVPLLNIVKEIERVKKKVAPELVFTHQPYCLNIDHRITSQAVITATRPMENETVKKVYGFEVLSSSEWNFPLRFNPNVFFDISRTVNMKIEAMKKYKGELRLFPHPRSCYGIWLNAQYWGMRCGVPFAEAFMLLREFL